MQRKNNRAIGRRGEPSGGSGQAAGERVDVDRESSHSSISVSSALLTRTPWRRSSARRQATRSSSGRRTRTAKLANSSSGPSCRGSAPRHRTQREFRDPSALSTAPTRCPLGARDRRRRRSPCPGRRLPPGCSCSCGWSRRPGGRVPRVGGNGRRRGLAARRAPRRRLALRALALGGQLIYDVVIGVRHSSATRRGGRNLKLAGRRAVCALRAGVDGSPRWSASAGAANGAQRSGGDRCTHSGSASSCSAAIHRAGGAAGMAPSSGSAGAGKRSLLAQHRCRRRDLAAPGGPARSSSPRPARRRRWSSAPLGACRRRPGVPPTPTPTPPRPRRPRRIGPRGAEIRMGGHQIRTTGPTLGPRRGRLRAALECVKQRRAPHGERVEPPQVRRAAAVKVRLDEHPIEHGSQLIGQRGLADATLLRGHGQDNCVRPQASE